MKLEHSRENYYFYSGKVSDIIRQLALAGIAIVWLFKQEVAGQPRIPSLLLEAAQALVLGLGADLFQYVAGTIAWGWFNRRQERRVGVDDEFTAPPRINWPTILFFWLKIVIVSYAYVLILRHLAAVIHAT